jgi:putative methionine-R-sulfoxide reductase with GAF domain
MQGWKVHGFGAHDDQPKTVDLPLAEAGVIGYAVGAARTATTNDGQGGGPGFATLPADRMGLAVPVIVGGRVVAVVYADSVGSEGADATVPNGWPEIIEVLARHAARCLETLTVQRAVQAPAQRVNVPAGMHGTDAGRPA